MIADPALEFWLRHVAADGGLWEPAGDSAYVVLPGPLRDAYRLPEELRVTADPDVAREEGATLLTAGHPVLAEAADRVLAAGDVGYLVLDRPAAVPPGRDVLQAEVREAFPTDHGRIDLSGEPAFVLHPVVRVGALVTYELSAEDRFQEEAERWVDASSRRELPAALARSLSKALCTERTVVPPAENLLPAIGHAHRLMDSAAVSRRAVLAAEVSGGFEAERGRAAAYYADAIAGIELRLAAATPDRAAVLRERLRATREEQARRLAEIAEKYEARHVIRPYRLHVLLVPALRVVADVLRGSRRYPMSFDWLLPTGVYAPVRCPSCSAEAALVAGKEKLGCEACLPPKPPTVAPAAKAPGCGETCVGRREARVGRREARVGRREARVGRREARVGRREARVRQACCGETARCTPGGTAETQPASGCPAQGARAAAEGQARAGRTCVVRGGERRPAHAGQSRAS